MNLIGVTRRQETDADGTSRTINAKDYIVKTSAMLQKRLKLKRIAAFTFQCMLTEDLLPTNGIHIIVCSLGEKLYLGT